MTDEIGHSRMGSDSMRLDTPVCDVMGRDRWDGTLTYGLGENGTFLCGMGRDTSIFTPNPVTVSPTPTYINNFQGPSQLLCVVENDNEQIVKRMTH